MTTPKSTQQLQGSVLSIVPSKDSTLCVDNTFHIAEINSSLKISKSAQVIKNAESPHRYSHAFGISPQAFFCIPIFGEKKAFILKFKDYKPEHIATLNDHDGDIESSAFSHDGHFFATGGQDGRVFFYDGKSFLPIISLLARSDYISTIKFSKSGEFVAISGFDKFTLIFDMLRHKIAFNFSTSDVVEDSAFFDNDEKLILVCRNNASIIFSLRDGKIISTEYPFAFWPTSIAIDSEENYALVGTRSEILYVIALKDNTKTIEIKNDHAGTASLTFSLEHLYIGSIDGALLIIDYNEGKEELKESLDKKDYKSAREAINKNIFLSIHPLTKVFDEVWPEILHQAIDLLNQDSIEEAIELTAPFVVNPTKKSEFDFYLAQKGGVKTFLELINKKDFTKAYEMLQTTKFLTKTQAYEKLENIWNKAFFNAKKLLIENANANKRLAEQSLAPFNNTPKKELIIQLLRNCDVFEKAEALIKKQNFKEYFSLTFQFSFLRETDLYKKVLIVGERMLANLIELEKNFHYDEAKQIAETLLVFPTLKRAANERIVLMQQKETLLNAIEAKDIKKVYSLIDEIESLRSMQQFKDFTKDFLRHYEEAKPYAYDGNAKHAMVVFGEYLEINYWVDKIGSLLKIAYLKQIERALNDPEINWIITLKRYFERYGKSFELVKLLQNHEAKAILDQFEGEGEGDGYRHYGFVDSIVIYLVQKEE
ncbi:hypothetical protein LS70_002360 [Helicobacter sp. MIT 11-5569]|uniref:WD40 repeat domain-containing protein n=1 Tax=Helicobacter sp. MIT 11-5569 TaxID=1548151 RepID=UPI00051F9FB5|nr:hypothetical protein [Helicobacter sp. MIT 11-5569]TLD84409.1 hypothetical protein LS70_002360 [Helicobacter sp. MIT 11-5569]